MLYHSRSRIWRLTGISVFCAGIATIAVMMPVDASYHGPYASLTTALGPTTLRWFMLIFGLGAILLMIGCLRLLLSSNREAARIDDDGITLRSMWGTKQFVWDEITGVQMKTSSYRQHSNGLLKIESRRRWAEVLPTSTIHGGDAAVQEFVATAKPHWPSVRASRRVRAGDSHLTQAEALSYIVLPVRWNAAMRCCSLFRSHYARPDLTPSSRARGDGALRLALFEGVGKE